MQLPLRKHIPPPSTSGLPQALRHEWSCDHRAGAVLSAPAPRVQGVSASRRHLGAPRHHTFWGCHLILLQSLCAKLEQCVVLACFNLYKNSPSLPYPNVLNIYINSYLNSTLEILFTLISLFSQEHLKSHSHPLTGYKCSPKLVCVIV